jgi:hypothetical protein
LLRVVYPGLLEIVDSVGHYEIALVSHALARRRLLDQYLPLPTLRSPSGSQGSVERGEPASSDLYDSSLCSDALSTNDLRVERGTVLRTKSVSVRRDEQEVK